MRLILTFIMMLVALPATAAVNQLNQDVQMCSGRPWIDITCNGADPTGAADSTTAINNTFNTAITNGFPVLFPAGTYKITSKLTIDYQGQAGNGIEIISRGAILDGRTITSGNAVQIQCSGGTTAVPVVCRNLRISGQLTILGITNAYVFVIGKTDFSDRQDGAMIEHLVVSNTNNNTAAGDVQLNYLTAANVWISASTSGGSSSTGALALEQVQFSRIAGYGSALGASAPAVLIENGASSGNTISGFEYDSNTNTCVSITAPAAQRNAWLVPQFPCPTAVNASGTGTQNALIGPSFAGANAGPVSSGVAVIGRGALNRYSAPTVASLTLYGTDDGTIFSPSNATGAGTPWTGASLPITLPDPAAVGVGWTAGFISDNNKATVLTAPAGRYILSANRQLTTLTVAATANSTNFEIAVLKSDGANFRVIHMSQGAALLNGIQSAYPYRYYYPGGPGYQLTQGDNGGVVSSGQTSGGLGVNLPQNTSVAPGWNVALAADAGKQIAVGVTTGQIVQFGGDKTTSFGVAAGEVAPFQFDGSNYRVMSPLPPAVLSDYLTGAYSTSRTSLMVTSDGTRVDSLVGPNVEYNAIAGISHNYSGGNLINYNAVAGYVWNDNPNGGNQSNSVALYGFGQANASGAFVYGINTIVNSTAGLSFTELVTEYDFDAANAGDVVIGALYQGASSVAPISAVGPTCGPLGIPTQIPWGTCFFSEPGAASVGMQLGELTERGANVSSQPMYFNIYDSVGNTKSWVIQGSPTSLNFYSNVSGNPFFQFNGTLLTTPGPLSAGLEINQLAGTGANISSQPVYFNVFDASGNPKSWIIQGSPTSLNFFSSITTSPTFLFNGSLEITSGVAIGLILGPQTGGVNVSSAPAYFSVVDSGGNPGNWIVAGTPTSLNFFSSGIATAPTFLFNGNVALTTTSQAFIINGQIVASNSGNNAVFGGDGTLGTVTIGNGGAQLNLNAPGIFAAVLPTNSGGKCIGITNTTHQLYISGNTC